MQVGSAVCRFDWSGFYACQLLSVVRIFGCQQVGCFFEVFGVYQVDDAGLVFGGITVDKVCTRGAKCSAMFAFLAVLERLAYLSITYVYCKMAASQAFYGSEDDLFTLCVESQDFADQPVAFG